MFSIEQAAKMISTAIERTHIGDWVKMTEVAELAGDLTIEEWRGGMEYLLIFDPNIEVMAEINQKTLTGMDRLYAIDCGGVQNHLIQRIG